MCTHHWRQAGNLSSPFECVRCGESKMMETSFEDIQERKADAHRNPDQATGAINKDHAISLLDRANEIAQLADWQLSAAG